MFRIFILSVLARHVSTWYRLKIVFLCDQLCKYLVELRSHCKHLRMQVVCEKTRLQQYSGYSHSRSPCDKPKQALIAIICSGQYMAVSMPGRGDLTPLMCRMVLSLTLSNRVQICIDASRARAFRTNSGRIVNCCPMRVACKKSCENNCELRVWPCRRMKSGFSATFFGVA